MDLDLRKLRYFAAVAEHGTSAGLPSSCTSRSPSSVYRFRALEQEPGARSCGRPAACSSRPRGAAARGGARGARSVDAAVRRVHDRPGRRAARRRVRARAARLRGRPRLHRGPPRHRDRAASPELVGAGRAAAGRPGPRRIPPPPVRRHRAPGRPGRQRAEGRLPARGPPARAVPGADPGGSRRRAGPRRARAADVLGRGEVRAHRRRARHRHGAPERRAVLLPARPRLPARDGRRTRRDLHSRGG
jgi:hypothetical protein